MRSFFKYYLLGVCALALCSCSDTEQTEKMFRYFLDRHVERIKPIQKQFNETVWAAYTGEERFDELMKAANLSDSLYLNESNSPEYYQGLLNSMYDNSSEFEILEKIKKSNLLVDPLLKRQFEKVFSDYVSMQNNWDEADKQKADLLNKFYDLKRRENSYFDSLANEPAEERKGKWISEFSSLTNDFKETIKALNRDVRALGYDSYFAYLMGNMEIPTQLLMAMADSVDELTRDDYAMLVAICQSGKCREACNDSPVLTSAWYRCMISNSICPYEWGCIAYSPDTMVQNLRDFFASGGFSIDEIYAKSDIWYQKEKVNNSFFFCADFDEEDFRIYSNSQPQARSLNPLIHEFAHALHYQSVDKSVPYLVRSPHTIIAEALAIYFDSKMYTSEAVQSELGLPAIKQNVLFQDYSNVFRLLFLRKLLRDIAFEKSIYENPDQNFDALWRKLNMQYLFIDPLTDERSPEWITSFHIVASEGANAGYLFATAYAAQLEYYYPDCRFAPIREKVMKYGDSLPWNELIRLSTGEPLNLKYLRPSYKRGAVPGMLALKNK